ncbi:hypothetical protein DIPPA_27939 [Diplonema papillatum]|nr:hypothetical protein DIPPA_27939 [Diplonema papillatum]
MHPFRPQPAHILRRAALPSPPHAGPGASAWGTREALPKTRSNGFTLPSGLRGPDALSSSKIAETTLRKLPA